MIKTEHGSDNRKEGKHEKAKITWKAKSSMDKFATFGGYPGLC